MRIGIVTYSLNVGGVETVMEILANHFSSQKHYIEFVETLSTGEASNHFKEKGFLVKTITIQVFETRNAFAIRLANALKLYDVLILNNVPFVHYLIGLLKEETIVLPILHNDIDEFYKNILINQQQWDTSICVSHALEEKFKMMKKIDENKLITINNGVKVSDIYPKKIEKNFKKIEILFVGRIENQQKGVLLLPEIIQKVIQDSSDHVHLKVIGEGPSLSLLKKITKASHVEDYISFLGSLKHQQVLKEMNHADILLMPSYYEGQGLVYLEAMAQGLIPIVSNLKNNTDLVIAHQKNGFLCPIGDSDAFAKEICYLIQYPEKISKISKEAWKTAHTSLSSNVMAQKYINLISDLKKNRKIIRSHTLIKIPYGNLPQFLFQSLNLLVKVKNKLYQITHKRKRKYTYGT